MIISASRRTDIPAFYSEWFVNRIKEGYLLTRNPRNTKQLLRIVLSPEIVDCIVFWTKNPIPMLSRLDELKDYCYYFQFTLTGYGKDIEANLPDKKKELLPAFIELSKKIGPDRVIWRYDPILVNDRYTVDYHMKAFKSIAEALNGYTKKCVFSFVDVYDKIKKSMADLKVRSLSDEEMTMMAVNIRDVAKANGMTVATCSEKIDLDALGISHNACVDRTLIEQLTGGKIKDIKKYTKDSGQRTACACMLSKEVGTLNTCGNGCIYCYANYSPETVKKSMAKYDPTSPILCDFIGEDEEIIDSSDMKSWLVNDGQMSIFDMK